MAKEIYRKVSLERLSSPEQLDQLLVVTTAKNWLALLALVVAVTAALIWGVFGYTDTTISGQGVIVRAGGISNVVSTAGGRVVELCVKVGDHVSSGQIVAKLSQPDLVQKLKNADEELVDATRARERQSQVNQEGDRAKLAAMNKQRQEIEQEIRDTREQIKYAKEQIPVDEQLLQKGLITHQAEIQDKQQLATLEQNVAKLQAQLAQMTSDEITMQHQNAQSLLDHKNKIDDLQRNRRLLKQSIEMSVNVVTPRAGRVVEVKTYLGAMIGANAPVVSVEPAEGTLEGLSYIPSDKVKEIEPGMEVHITPSGVEREEYGYMLGTVRAVAQFPATTEAIVSNFENDSLAKSLTSSGPVTEVRINLTPDPSTRSGYAWSSSRGPAMSISSGSVCGVEVATRKQHPIEQVFPYVKKKLGFK